MEQANKLFIGNLPYATDTQTLVDLFSQFGNVTDAYKPQQKGFAFITFETAEEAAKAMEEMNGKEIEGREINVSIAKPREEGPRRTNNFSRGGGSRGGNGGGRGGFGGGDRGGRDRRREY